MLGHATDTPTTRRVPVEEAAKFLGITANAVRKRIERGTLPSEREGDTRYVLLNVGMPKPTASMPLGMPGDQILMVERLESEIAFLRDLLRSRDEDLRREREAREEAERRRDTIIMRMAERLPEVEGAQESSERRSWFYRFFFGT